MTVIGTIRIVFVKKTHSEFAHGSLLLRSPFGSVNTPPTSTLRPESISVVRASQ